MDTDTNARVNSIWMLTHQQITIQEHGVLAEDEQTEKLRCTQKFMLTF